VFLDEQGVDFHIITAHFFKENFEVDGVIAGGFEADADFFFEVSLKLSEPLGVVLKVKTPFSTSPKSLVMKQSCLCLEISMSAYIIGRPPVKYILALAVWRRTPANVSTHIKRLSVS
jgi:hypothetical protein